jgi:hypothetical protein
MHAAEAGIAAQGNVLDRIVLVGASASSGFTKRETFGGTNTQFLRLDRYLDAAITMPHQPVQNFSSAFFFLNPTKTAETQLARVHQADPTLVVGVDFPFWFCYGKGSNDVERLSRFDEGLKFLEGISCPLVIGDLPDASEAVGKILSPNEIPSSKVLAAANAKLAAWAETRTNVYVLPLAHFMQTAAHNEPMQARHYTIAGGETSRLLQEDRLHPTTTGCSVLALAILEAVAAKQNLDNAVNWNVQSIEQSVGDAVRKAQLAASTNQTAKVNSATQQTEQTATPAR